MWYFQYALLLNNAEHPAPVSQTVFHKTFANQMLSGSDSGFNGIEVHVQHLGHHSVNFNLDHTVFMKLFCDASFDSESNLQG